MIKKLIIAPVLAVSIIGIMPIGASAEWKKDSNKNYSWVEKGVKAKGWKYINNSWYNFRTDGVMQTGWLKDGEDWYYLWSDGTMAHDTWFTNGAFWYYFDSTGKMLSDSVVVKDRGYDVSKPTFIISKDLDNKDVTNTTTADSKTSATTGTVDNTATTTTTENKASATTATVENTASTAITTDKTSSTSTNTVVK